MQPLNDIHVQQTTIHFKQAHSKTYFYVIIEDGKRAVDYIISTYYISCFLLCYHFVYEI